MSSEDYVRPPIVALELRSQRVAIWRFRIIMGVLLAVLLLIIVLVAHTIVQSGDGNGTVGLRNLGVLATSLR